MDRISALRNIEEALAEFETGSKSLSDLEQDVRGTLRTYATEFEGDLQAYRASGEAAVDGLVVLAPSETAARERVQALVADAGEFTVTVVE
ncbi:MULTISPECIES: DUF7854 family protein [Haloarcula]|uniref:Uncharacterized protein n=1 Tax=Haloarcula amylolytica JCM 13557 TaxID=1227452 RepID=M0KYE2_9EURY|nr:hypothetical protein [Haloarcula amylolytica]EMA25873.1 hypothetical protein C442_00952 [Haloarcula amylolytica JCM 13557]